MIYLDYSKVFDKMDHKVLLKRYGIGGKVLCWIEQFLTNRTQTVQVEGVLSSPQAVVSGVPQGTVLGPILFLLYCTLMNFFPHSRTAKDYALLMTPN